MRSLFALPVLALCLWIPAMAGDSEVNTDFDPAVDFTKFKTYSFIGGHELVKTGLLKDPQVRERIKNFISGVMELHGLTEVPRDQKYDMAVRYWVARQDQREEQAVYYQDPMVWGGYPPYWSGAWSWCYTEYIVHNYVEGTLVVDLLNPVNKELLWRTYLRQKIEDRPKAYDQAKKNLNKSFDMFPPDEKEKEKMQKERERLAKKYAE
jgi:hypothetical protein